jgi:hypothetical protein
LAQQEAKQNKDQKSRVEGDDDDTLILAVGTASIAIFLLSSFTLLTNAVMFRAAR